MSGIISDEALLELERQRVALRDILRIKGMTVASDETMNNLITLVNQLRYNDYFSDYAQGIITEVIDDRMTSVKGSMFSGELALEQIKCPNITTVGGGAFSNCTALRHFYAPLISTGKDNLFVGCSVLKVLYLKNIDRATNYTFMNMTNLEKFIAPKFTTSGYQSFDNDNNIKVIDTAMTSFFLKSTQTTQLETVILRKTSVVTLSNSNIITNNDTQFYVPSSLISTYETATNWSAVPNISSRLHALEGSAYENEDWYEGTQDYRTEVLGE